MPLCEIQLVIPPENVEYLWITQEKNKTGMQKKKKKKELIIKGSWWILPVAV